MKKLFFIAAMAGAALVSCTKNDSVDVAQPEEIRFSVPVVEANTKAVAGEIVNPYDTKEHFSVYAFWSENDFTKWDNTAGSLYMDNANTTYDDTFNGWRANDRYYWPKHGGKLTFAAYSPTDAKNDATGEWKYDSKGLSFATWTVKTNAEEQYDLMYSKRTYNKTASTGGTTYEGVDINFQHALSSIQFTMALKEEYTGTTITLQSIKLWGVKSQASFDENIDETTPSVYKSSPEWTGHTKQVEETDAYVSFEGSKVLSTGKAVLDVEAGHNDLILLPQPLTEAAMVELVYTIDAPGTDTPAVTQTYSRKLFDLTSEWKIGYRYIYNITLGLDEIYFSPEVREWTNIEVTVPEL